jgi:hypothetical protein
VVVEEEFYRCPTLVVACVNVDTCFTEESEKRSARLAISPLAEAAVSQVVKGGIAATVNL